MSKPRLLDVFCGAGGCTKGYQDAGFYVVGVDLHPQSNYCGDEFVQADALEVLDRLTYGLSLVEGDLRWHLEDFAAIHASPPCPRYSLVSGFHGVQDDHPDLVAPVRDLLGHSGLPWVMENVPGSPLRPDVTLCGEMFGLRVHRHRVFELGGWFMLSHPHSRHLLRGGKTNCETGPGVARWITGHYADHDDASDAMGIDWMDRSELRNSIPPAYTQHIGEALLAHVAAQVAA